MYTLYLAYILIVKHASGNADSEDINEISADQIDINVHMNDDNVHMNDDNVHMNDDNDEGIQIDVGTSLNKTNKVLDRKALMANLNEESIYLEKRIQSKFNTNKQLLRKDRMCQQTEISDTIESEFRMYSRSAYTELIKIIPEYIDDSDDNESHVNVSKTDAYGDQDTLDNAIIKAKRHVHGASVCIEECDMKEYPIELNFNLIPNNNGEQYIKMDDHVINNASCSSAYDQVIDDVYCPIVDSGSCSSTDDYVINDMMFSSSDISIETISIEGCT